MDEVFIDELYITLGQLLKYIDLVSSGGQVKHFLLENNVTVNNIKEDRRGRKLYENDIIGIENVGSFRIKSSK